MLDLVLLLSNRWCYKQCQRNVLHFVSICIARAMLAAKLQTVNTLNCDCILFLYRLVYIGRICLF